jgi:hypothetical protein
MNNPSQHHPASGTYPDNWDEVAPCKLGTINTDGTRQPFDAMDDAQEIEPVAFPSKHGASYYPAITARTSLFCVSRIARDDDPDDMQIPVKVELSGQNGYKLTAWGPRLNMHDKLVWETAVQYAFENQHGFGSRFPVSLRDFAKRMGKKGAGGSSLKWIWHSMRRLYHTRLDFELPSGVKGGGSIFSTAIKDENGNFLLRLNPDFCAPVFFNDHRFLIKVQRRNQLPNQLSKWLHDFFSTHNGFESPQGTGREQHLTFSRARELSGYRGSRSQFAKDLPTAMSDLVQLAPDLIASFELEKEGRNSDTWTLKLVRGTEKPTYIIPDVERIEKDIPTKIDRPIKKKRPNSGGVVL